MKLCALVLAMLLLSVPAFAADVDGKWSGSISTPNGDFMQSFTLKADGAKLTGTTLGLDGVAVPITGGKIEGNNISFSVTLEFGGMPFTLTYKGVVSPTEIQMSGDAGGGMPFMFIVKKTS